MAKDSAARIELGRSFHQVGTVNEKVSESDFVDFVHYCAILFGSCVACSERKGLIFLILYKANLKDRAVLAMWSEKIQLIINHNSKVSGCFE